MGLKIRRFGFLLVALGSSAFMLPPLANAQTQGGELTPTPSTGTGPAFIEDAPFTATLWRDGDPGERLMLRGHVMDVDGAPVAGAVVNVWQADGAGSYHDDAYRGKVTTDAAGAYAFRTAVPASYYGARHIHMRVTHEGFETLDTRVEFKDDPALEGRSKEHAIVLEETRVQGLLVYVGDFDVVMTAR